MTEGGNEEEMTELVCVFYEKVCPCAGTPVETVIMHSNVPYCAGCGAMYRAVVGAMVVRDESSSGL